MNPLFSYAMKSLRKNKARTIVTIIGILLSSSLITALATLGVSMYRYMQEGYIRENGDWHLGITGAAKADVEALLSELGPEVYLTAESLGYARVENADPDKPYLYIRQVTQEYYEHMPIRVTQGRLPQQEGEILLPESFRRAAGGEPSGIGVSSAQEEGGLKCGSGLTLEVGLRMLEGTVLWQHVPYGSSPDGVFRQGGPEETLLPLGTYSYTVTGFYEAGDGYGDRTPGYEALTWWDGVMERDGYNRCCLWFCLPKVTNNRFHEVYDRIRLAYGYDGSQLSVNLSLLGLYGVRMGSKGESAAVAAAALILLAVILAGSVMLIYNAFAISVGERTRQFGLLSSVGATERQIRGSVLWEAGMVSLAGVLPGIVIGVGLVAALLRMAGGTLAELLEFSIEPGLYVWPPALFCAAALAVLTVLVSALIPAGRATRVTAMEAIRQSRDISYAPGRSKAYGRTEALLGYEGVLALVYSNRNRRRYRITTLALFLSMVLFVSVNAFADYMTTMMQIEYKTSNYDVLVQLPSSAELTEDERRELVGILMGMEGVSSAVCPVYHTYHMPFEENRAHVTKEFGGILQRQAQTGRVSAAISTVDDETFLDFCREQGLDAAVFLNPEAPTVIVNNSFRAADPETGNTMLVEGLLEEDGRFYVDLDSDRYQREDYQERIVEFTAGCFVERLAPGCNDNWNLSILMPESMGESLGLRTPAGNALSYCLVTANHRRTAQEAEELMETKYPGGSVYDLAARQAGNRNLVLLVRFLANVFIVTVSLISMANVFSTISSSLKLRQKEFAMLKTVGMTDRGLGRMLNLECLLYGGKAVLLGLPVSLGICGAMYYYFHKDVIFAFYLPVQSILIAAGSIFGVVFVTMLYTMGRMRDGNVIDVLKQESF